MVATKLDSPSRHGGEGAIRGPNYILKCKGAWKTLGSGWMHSNKWSGMAWCDNLYKICV